MPMEESAEQVADETSTIPSSLLAGQTVNPGDVVRLEVVSVDEDSGNVTVKYASDPSAEEEPGGVASMAAEFD